MLCVGQRSDFKFVHNPQSYVPTTPQVTAAKASAGVPVYTNASFPQEVLMKSRGAKLACVPNGSTEVVRHCVEKLEVLRANFWNVLAWADHCCRSVRRRACVKVDNVSPRVPHDIKW